MSANDIKAGTNIEVDGAPWRVLGILRPQFVLIFCFAFEICNVIYILRKVSGIYRHCY